MPNLKPLFRGFVASVCGMAFFQADVSVFGQDRDGSRNRDAWLGSAQRNRDCDKSKSRSNSSQSSSSSKSSKLQITEVPDEQVDSGRSQSSSSGSKSIKPTGKTRQPTKEELQWLADMPKDVVIIDADGTIVVPPGKSEKEIKEQFANQE